MSDTTDFPTVLARYVRRDAVPPALVEKCQRWIAFAAWIGTVTTPMVAHGVRCRFAGDTSAGALSLKQIDEAVVFAIGAYLSIAHEADMDERAAWQILELVVGREVAEALQDTYRRQPGRTPEADLAIVHEILPTLRRRLASE